MTAAAMTTKETLREFDEEFQTVRMTADSLLVILEMEILDAEVVSNHALNHPHHETQKMHALVVALRHQFMEGSRLVDKLVKPAV